MPRLVLWVDDVAAPTTTKILAAFQQAIQWGDGVERVASDRALPTSVILQDLATWQRHDQRQDSSLATGRADASDWQIPLTFNLPPTLELPARAIAAACEDVTKMRQSIAQWGYTTGAGDFCLPIVLTAKGPLYAEAIGPAMATPDLVQPVHLSDAIRQPLYALSQQLLRSLAAPPAVYLMQFGMPDQNICFDRLLPFPDARAIASIGVQVPDLFACHWRCLTHQPIHDLII